MALTDIVGDGNEVLSMSRGDVGSVIDILDDDFFIAPIGIRASMWVGKLEEVAASSGGNTYSRGRVVNA